MNAAGIGSACVELGAGRHRKEDEIDHGAGIVLRKKTGDAVKKGEVIASLYSSKNEFLDIAALQFEKSVTFSEKKPDEIPILLEIIE